MLSDKLIAPFILGLVAGGVWLSFKYRKEWTWEPVSNIKDTQDYRLELVPLDDGKGFRLDIENKTDTSLYVNWDECRYLKGGSSKGFFKGMSKTDVVLPRLKGTYFLYPQAQSKMRTVVHPSTIIEGKTIPLMEDREIKYDLDIGYAGAHVCVSVGSVTCQESLLVDNKGWKSAER